MLLASCAVPGAPQPPSLELPRPPHDLRAFRKGDAVSLVWTAPNETTDAHPLKRRGVTRICRAVGVFPMDTCQDVRHELPASETEARAVDVLSFESQVERPTAFVSYAVEVLNERGRSAGLSNQVRVPLAPTLPPPEDLHAQVTPEGVVLTFTAVPHPHESLRLSHVFRIYRRVAGTNTETIAGELEMHRAPQGRFLDRGAEWEKSYEYSVTVVTRIADAPAGLNEVEGSDSRAVRAAVHDVFPPATPSGVQAVASLVGGRSFVDLTWAPNTEADLAGYHVYRRSEGGSAERLTAEPVVAPAFRDAAVAPRDTYYYSVAAVDLRGNQSARSAEARESVPGSP